MSPELDAIAAAARQITDATAARNAAMRTARDAGHTWRAIATAAGMTETGARKALGVGTFGRSTP